MNTLIYTVHIMNAHDKEDGVTLGILEAIEKNNDVTQRHLADKLDVALGLANSYLKRCVHKGLVKIQQAPANRYLYYLTPKGFSEKSRLTAEYLTTSFDFYRRAGQSLTETYNECEQKGIRKILFCGVSELAEIASLRVQEHKIEIVGTWDPYSDKKQFLHHSVWQSLVDADEYDACLLTALNDATAMYELLREQTDIDRILVPSILGISSMKTDSTK